MCNIITRIMFCVLVLCFVFRSTRYLAASSVISLAHTFFPIRNLSHDEYVCVYHGLLKTRPDIMHFRRLRFSYTE